LLLLLHMAQLIRRRLLGGAIGRLLLL